MAMKLSYAQEVCVKAAGRAMQTTGMLEPGCRVGVAASGGVDSFVLLKVMQLRQRIVPFRFEFMALHVNPGFDPDNHRPLTEWLAAEGIAGHLEVSDHGPRGHSPENRRNSPCFYCARLRRKRLFALCARYKLTHLAFGHNADDLVSTFLLNLVQTGRVDLFFRAACGSYGLCFWWKRPTSCAPPGVGNCRCGPIPAPRPESAGGRIWRAFWTPCPAAAAFGGATSSTV